MSGIPTTQSGRIDRNKKNRSMSIQMRKAELQVRPVLFEREQPFAIRQLPVVDRAQLKRRGKQYQDVLSVLQHLRGATVPGRAVVVVQQILLQLLRPQRASVLPRVAVVMMQI